MNIKVPQIPWQPSCWVGGFPFGENWVSINHVEISTMPDDSRRKYAAVKAVAAIMKAMRK